MILNSPTISGSLTVTGNIIASGSITLSGSIASASYAASASFVALAQSASYVLTAQTSSFVANAQTASFVALAQSASNAVSAQTASFANTFTVASTLTAQTLVVQTITSSVEYITGSSINGSLNSNTHLFTGSVSISGSSTTALNVNAGTLFVSSSGNVGIGLTNPTDLLHLYKSGTVYQTIQTVSGGAGTVYRRSNSPTPDWTIGHGAASANENFEVYTAGTGSFVWTMNGSERIRINSSGNVGIGTSSPSRNLVVQNSATISLISIVANPTSIAYLLLGDTDSDSSGRVQYDNNIDSLQLYTSNAERMRITSGGWSKISNNGTYLSTSSPYHEIYSNQNNNAALVVTNSNNTYPYGIYMLFTGTSPNDNTRWFYNGEDTTATRFIVRSNGGIVNYQANDTNLSDIRTKKDISLLGSYWDKFKAIEIVKFKYKDQTHDDYNIGLIAQQLESIAPEFIDTDGWGKQDIENEEPLKSVYTSDLNHATIKVLQEAMTKIEKLQTQNDALQSRIETLESK